MRTEPLSSPSPLCEGEAARQLPLLRAPATRPRGNGSRRAAGAGQGSPRRRPSPRLPATVATEERPGQGASAGPRSEAQEGGFGGRQGPRRVLWEQRTLRLAPSRLALHASRRGRSSAPAAARAACARCCTHPAVPPGPARLRSLRGAPASAFRDEGRCPGGMRAWGSAAALRRARSGCRCPRIQSG